MCLTRAPLLYLLCVLSSEELTQFVCSPINRSLARLLFFFSYKQQCGCTHLCTCLSQTCTWEQISQPKKVALLNQRAREFSTVLDIPKLLSRIMNYCVLLPAGVKVSLFTCSSYLTNSCHGQSRRCLPVCWARPGGSLFQFVHKAERLVCVSQPFNFLTCKLPVHVTRHFFSVGMSIFFLIDLK